MTKLRSRQQSTTTTITSSTSNAPHNKAPMFSATKVALPSTIFSKNKNHHHQLPLIYKQQQKLENYDDNNSNNNNDNDNIHFKNDDENDNNICHGKKQGRLRFFFGLKRYPKIWMNHQHCRQSRRSILVLSCLLLFIIVCYYNASSSSTLKTNANNDMDFNVGGGGGYDFSPLKDRRQQQRIIFSVKKTPKEATQIMQEKPRNIGLHMEQEEEEEDNNKNDSNNNSNNNGRGEENSKNHDDYDDRRWSFAETMIITGTEQLYPPIDYTFATKKRLIYVSSYEKKKREILLDSEEYEMSVAESFRRVGDDSNGNKNGNDCEYIHKWQHTIRPTCNTLHETLPLQVQSFNRINLYGGMDTVRLISTGGYQRDVWLTREYDGSETHVTKTFKVYKDFTVSKIIGQQQDAIAMERLTHSPYIMNIYGFCGTSAIHEISKEPMLMDQLIYDEGRQRDFNLTYKVQIAQQVAAAVADMHFTEGDDQLPTISHADIMTDQFLFVEHGRRVKLNDFNRGDMLKWNKTSGKLCGYKINFNGGKNRSPEEYLYQTQTDKVDVYHMGNVFYSLLTEEKPFFDAESTDEVIKMVKKGGRPNLNHPVIVSQKDTNPLVQLLLETMDMCWTFDPEKRPNSRQVHAFLTRKMKELKLPIL